MTDQIRLGNAVLTRVAETQVQIPTTLWPSTPPEAWHAEAELLAPRFWNPATDLFRIAIQSWVLQVDGLTIVIDTGAGNDRHRPHMPPLDHLSTPFLDNMRAAGIDPAAVDVVLNTHLHTDHVGWNTQLVDGAWVPTFPNARYLMPEADHRFFAPDNPETTDEMRTVFEDSVIPVADQTELFSGDYQLSDSVWLRPAPGHTPGSSVLWLDAGKPAVFVGDLTHCPIQIPRPDDPCAYDVNAAEATVTRKRVFTEASRRRAAVVPAHYAGHGGATIVARGDRFMVDDWLDLSPA
ncbi:MBL fold metallo-hydrolase [Mycolicibacterium sp. NCC-Tsukiji]|jgi:glyoxylase-like metal-dependent hydrolase (beta-lactamase superfamily II)|uniref:MBL fold metallo-hydrolase n=1 Tax=Mycobacteriaceae TaxID=1762 RepID=UPI000EEAAFB8|nr:MBL fold metallo-hydrolase [Mycolicibacterium sp. NCC-Tsukiji]GCA99209.1 MBL fold metallo-hydrolase [Mycolicibacterium sp. NCC-Tsukiji]